ncbi:MAG: sulfonate transport system ATP-binding protein [Candidatus Tokpelaia sp. JSC188]|nr:MAG: sulfonate transport system ATP-binding protein [Candidatus Tokpelaia sp. JSC188]
MITFDSCKTLEPHHNLNNAQIRSTGNNVDLLLEKIAKSFDNKPVLKGIDLSIEQHEFVAVLGKSGCGKSTLLRILGGLEQPDSGRILKAGKSYQADKTRVLFQEPRLLPWLNLLDNVTLALPDRWNKEKSRKMAHDILLKVDLQDQINSWPSYLSGGQKQRVALARALISTPQILAMDEPFSALDALTRFNMQHLLEQVWIENGFTVILVTHDVGEAILLADRVVLIEEGIITQNIAIDFPRPRKVRCHTLNDLENDLLDQLLKIKAA